VKQAETETWTIKCWRASLYDTDGDGYARADATDAQRTTFTYTTEVMDCPTGYVKARGDCDDSNASVYPRRLEVYGNGVDDNCDGKIDEPTVDYHYLGFSNTADGFTMRVRIHDAATVAAFTTPGSQLVYEVEYQKLVNTGVSSFTPKTVVASLTNLGYRRAEVRLTGLEAVRVYRARIRFFQRVGGVDTPVGQQSDWYYTATSAASGVVSIARTAIVLRALYEYYLSAQFGYTGYLGKTYVNGTRYNAPANEGWCSELYCWSAAHELSVGHCASIRPVADYFDGFAAYTRVTDPDAVKSSLMRGDYLALDTNLDGDRNHSVMVLAYDSHLDEVWTLEGNISGSTQGSSRMAGNETWIRTRSLETLHGWGKIVSAMLD
jgi:hypothetical protein